MWCITCVFRDSLQVEFKSLLIGQVLRCRTTAWYVSDMCFSLRRVSASLFSACCNISCNWAFSSCSDGPRLVTAVVLLREKERVRDLYLEPLPLRSSAMFLEEPVVRIEQQLQEGSLANV